MTLACAIPPDPAAGPLAGAGLARAAVARLSLQDFRSYASLRITVDPRPVVLTGANGAGKTNLLEAISLLAPGRGLRRARLADIDRTGGGPWSVAARLEGVAGPVAVGTGRIQEGGRERRRVRIDGETVAGTAALAELVRMVWLTPAMDRLFQDGPSGRRRFLDRLVLTGEPAHAAEMARYGHALRERARLLRAGRADPAWLGALEAKAAAAGIAVAAGRRQAVAGLRAALLDDLDAFPRPELAIEGEVETWLDQASALDCEARLMERLAAARTTDAALGTTTIGPHRSDLVVRDRQSGRLAMACSTGQQKALLIGIVLAEARLRAATGDCLPILLLDEVAAHLDPARRAQLFEALLQLDAQAWLTGTDAATFAPLGERAQFLAVRDSTLHPRPAPR